MEAEPSVVQVRPAGVGLAGPAVGMQTGDSVVVVDVVVVVLGRVRQVEVRGRGGLTWWL